MERKNQAIGKWALLAAFVVGTVAWLVVRGVLDAGDTARAAAGGAPSPKVGASHIGDDASEKSVSAAVGGVQPQGAWREVARGGDGMKGVGSRGQRRHFELLEATPAMTRFRFVSGAYSVHEETDGQGRLRSIVTMEDGWPSAMEGKPSLPVYRVNLAVAAGRGRRVVVRDAVWDEVPCSPPKASSGVAMRNVEPVDAVEDVGVYGGLGCWPEETASIGAESYIRAVAFAGVAVRPAVYDFTRGTLKICRSCEISVESDGATPSDYGTLSSNRDFAQIQVGGVLNSELLNTRGTTGAVVGHLAFILPDGWLDNAEFASYVAWRRLQGYDVTVLGYPSGTDVEGKTGGTGILATVRGLYESWSLTHLVLVGRPDDVPSALLSSSKTSRNNPGAIVACSDVAYGLLSGDDFHQDIFLSRLSVASSDELTLVLGKLLSFEQVGYSAGEDDSWRTTCEYIGGNDIYLKKYTDRPPEYDDYAYDYQAVDAERQRMEDGGAVTESRCQYQTGAVAPDKLAVKGDLDLGESLVVYMGHGKNTLWATSKFSITEAVALKNEGRLPFVSSCVCLTGNFGMTTGKCLAEAFLCAQDGGGCGMLASTCETGIFPPMYMMTALDDMVIAAGGPDGVYCQGAYALDAILAGVEYCETTTYSGSGTQSRTARQMHLIGDCSLSGRFRSLEQPGMTVTWKEEHKAIDVCVTRGGKAAVGIPVAAHDGDADALACGWTDAAGQVTLSVSDEPWEDALTVTAYDPQGGLSTVVLPSSVPALDVDGDGFISHEELLAYLKVVTKARLREQAIASWVASGQDASRSQESAASAPEGSGEDAVNAGASGDGVGESSGVSAGTGHYGTYGEMVARMRSLCMEALDVCRLVTIGESVQGRRIYGLCLGSGIADGSEVVSGCVIPELLVAGGFMGDERASVELPLMLAEWLVRHRDDASVLSMLQGARLYVVPCLNPDGMASQTPYNGNGVNLFMSFPDGVRNGSLGMFGNGDSLWLDEELSYEESGRWYKTSQMPETAAFMRWCSFRHFASALILRSGDLAVTYPYGNNDTYSKVDTPTADDSLLESLACGYVSSCGVSGMVAVNAAERGPMLGMPMDWLYRYLGSMALTVWMCQEREPDFSSVQELFEQHLGGLAAWMRAGSQGIGGTVKDVSGHGLPCAAVKAGGGVPVYTSGDGSYFRTTLGNAMLTVSAPGYESTNVFSGQEKNLDIVLNPSEQATAEICNWGETVYPNCDSRVTWTLNDWGGNGEACIVSLRMASGAGEMLPEGGSHHAPTAWRWEADGSVSLLYADSGREAATVCDLPVRWGDDVSKDHLVSLETMTASGAVNRKWHCRAAKPVTIAVPAGAFYSASGIRRTPLTGQDLFRWNGKSFVAVSVEDALTGYWRGEATGAAETVSGWYPEHQELQRGWNFIGVPLPVPAGWFSAAFEISGSVYTPVAELLPGKSYWVFSEKAQSLRYE